MVGRLANTQSCYRQQNAGSLTTSEIPKPNKAGIANPGIDMAAETTQHCQPQTVAPETNEHQGITSTSSTVETIPSKDHNTDIESLVHFYSCCKLSFMIKLASLQNVKALGYALSEEELKREEESIENARTKALEAWQQIHDRGFSYDMIGAHYLRSCTLH